MVMVTAMEVTVNSFIANKSRISVFNPLMYPRNIQIAFSVGLAVLTWSSGHNAYADNWKITPRISVNETYTDNVGLSPAAEAQHDFITQINPGVAVTKHGGRLDVLFDYSLTNLIHARETHRNDSYHQLSGSANAELIKDKFFVDANASVSQQNISLLGPLSVSNTTNTENQGTVNIYGFSPYFRHSFGNSAAFEGRYAHDVTSSNGSSITDSESNRVNLNLHSGPSFNDIYWGLDYVGIDVDHEDDNDVQSKTIRGDLRYQLSRKLGLIYSAGYEDYGYNNATQNPEGSFWRAGFGWSPSTRTSLGATFGKRFYGDTYSLDFSHRTRRTSWTAVYSQDVVTAPTDVKTVNRLLIGRIDSPEMLEQYLKTQTPYKDDPVALQTELDKLVAAGGLTLGVIDRLTLLSDLVYLSKRFQVSNTITTGKSAVTLSAFSIVDEALQSQTVTSVFTRTGDFANSNTIKRHGLTASWNWRFAPRTSAGVSGLWTRNVFADINRTDNLFYFDLGLTRQLQRTLYGSVNYRHTARDASQNGSDYKENAISLQLNKYF